MKKGKPMSIMILSLVSGLLSPHQIYVNPTYSMQMKNRMW